MKRNLITICMLLLASLGAWSQESETSFDATILAKQSMTDNASSPTSLVNWTVSKDGTTLENSQAPIASHVTTLNIDASAISGTISSVSVFANSKVDIAGELLFNGTTATPIVDRATSVYHSSGKDGSGGTCDVVTVEGSATTCKAYLLPVALVGGVTVTVKTTDGKYYTQDFTDDIKKGETKTLTITNTTAGQLWMSTIPGNVYFSMLSTPGAHDAATSGVTSYTSASKCQDMTIQKLLDAGVRCFDIRPGYYYTTTITESNLYIYHGQVSTNVLYKDAMATLVDFVKNNPTEAITITMVKENCKPTLSLSSWTDRSSEMWTVIDAIQESYKDYMKTLDHSYYTLDDFRGKICYINRTGTKASYTTQITNWPDDGTVSDYSCVVGLHNASIQDKYNTNGTDKQTAIEEMLQQSSSCTTNKNMHFNFCSSANSPGSYASATNPAITTYLNGDNISGPTGYLYADYIGSSSNGGADLLTAIINQNYKYVYNGTPTITPLYDADAENMDLSQGHSVAWTTTGTWSDGYGEATDTHASEAYAGWSSVDNANFALTRKMYLPAGKYKLTGYALYRDGDVAYVPGSTKLFAKNGTDVLGSTNIAKMTTISNTGDNDLQKAANSFGEGNYLNTVYFVLTEAATVTLGYEGTHNGTKQWFVAGPVALERLDEIVASDDSPVDVTSFIDNPTIYNTTQSTCPSGWTEYARVAGNGNYTTSTGDTQIENWHGTPSSARFDYYQTLTLPAGKYTLGADLLYRNGGADEVGIYAYDVVTGARASAAVTTIDANLHKVNLDFYTSGGDVNIGIINLKTMTGDWFAADNFTLTYYGAESAESISRATAEGKYGTICLPYTSTATGATAYSATISNSGSTVELTEVKTSLEAGTPYLYKATDSSQSFNFAFGSRVTTPTASDPLVGSFELKEVPSDGKAYLLQTQNNVQAFYKVTSSGLKVGKYKAYLYNNSDSTAAKLSIGLDTEDDEVSTAIDALNALTNGTAKIYDAQGRQRLTLQKGINIINGCKVVVK